MRTHVATGMMIVSSVLLIAIVSTATAQQLPTSASGGSDDMRCFPAVDPQFVSATGTIHRGCADCWGLYTFIPDNGARIWGVAPECSIVLDWSSLMGKRVQLDGLTYFVHGGIAGRLGAALGVTRLEVMTPTIEASWGLIRMLYR